jgi:hypothetical protein
MTARVEGHAKSHLGFVRNWISEADSRLGYRRANSPDQFA